MDKLEVVLQPGDFHFGDANTRIRTLLGSCVSITMWHPEKRIGGMCHYMLPSRSVRKASLDGRYADEAMEMFMREIRRSGTHPSEYIVKAFGAGNMFPDIARNCACKGGAISQNCTSVSCRNAGTAKSIVAMHGFRLEAHDLGGAGHRNITFDIGSGHVWVRHRRVQTEKSAPFAGMFPERAAVHAG